VDARSAPETVLRSHASDEGSDFRINARSSRPPARATAPAPTEPFTTGDAGRESRGAGLDAQTGPFRVPRSSEWRHASSVEWSAAAFRSTILPRFAFGEGQPSFSLRSSHRREASGVQERSETTLTRHPHASIQAITGPPGARRLFAQPIARAAAEICESRNGCARHPAAVSRDCPAQTAVVATSCRARLRASRSSGRA
jgi:hypothetical protein